MNNPTLRARVQQFIAAVEQMECPACYRLIGECRCVAPGRRVLHTSTAAKPAKTPTTPAIPASRKKAIIVNDAGEPYQYIDPPNTLDEVLKIQRQRQCQ